MSEDHFIIENFDEPPHGMARPPEFHGAPPWAWMLFDQQRKLGGAVQGLSKKLGDEPDSDGKGGKGLIGDLRKTQRDLSGLLDLKKQGIAAVAAITLFGALIIAGIAHFVQQFAAQGK